MTGLSNTDAANLAAYYLGTPMPTPPAGLYVAFFNGDPTNAGTGGAEVTTSIRAAGRLAGSFTRSGGVLTLNTALDYGNAVANTTFTHLALFDAQSGGTMRVSSAAPGGSTSVSAGTDVQLTTATTFTFS